MRVLMIGLSMSLLLATSSVLSMPGSARMPNAGNASQPMDNPAVIVRQGMTKMLGFLQQNKQRDPKVMMAFLEQEIAPYFDFTYMTRWVAGRAFRQMTDDQLRTLSMQLKTQFLGTLAQRLSGYGSQNVRFFRPRAAQGNEVTVGVGIMQPGGYPSKLDFRFYKSPQGWKVFDVTANRSSALVHYRQHFSRILRQQRASQRRMR